MNNNLQTLYNENILLYKFHINKFMNFAAIVYNFTTFAKSISDHRV